MGTLLLAAVALLGCEGVIEPPAAGPLGGGPGGLLPPFEPAPPVFARLTSVQYRNALVDLFGDDLPATPVEADTNPYLFDTIGATTTTLSEHGAEQYAEAAHGVADAVFGDPTRRSALAGCEPAAPGDDCARAFLARVGRRILRRPLTAEELDRWASMSVELAGGDPWRGLRLAVAGLLQSPAFLYRVEIGEPHPELPGRRRYTGYEMASRLSFLFWSTTPDDTLLDAAERGELVTIEGVYNQAVRLLEHPRARDSVRAFFAQFLDLGRLDGISRDPARYPHWTPTMARSMRTEVELLADDLVFRRDGDVRELFSAPRAFVNSELAALYGVEAPGATAIAFVPVELPAGGARAGLLTSGAFLAMNAHETETSPTLRGKYVRERVLCQHVPPPPDDVDVNLEPEPGMPRTLRERLEAHRAIPRCASCHSFIDPPGFLFEGFDSVGRSRTHEATSGYPVDTSGDLDGTPLRDARDLAELLREDERVAACMVRQLYRFASGRLEQYSEEAALRDLVDDFGATGFRFQDLLLELATSDAFRTLAPPDGAEEER